MFNLLTSLTKFYTRLGDNRAIFGRGPPTARGHRNRFGYRLIAKAFLEKLAKIVPYKIHTILTDNGIQFAKREGTEAYWTIPFDRICDALGMSIA